MEPARVLETLYTFPVEGILNSIASLAAQEISLLRGFKKELTKLRESVLAIQEFLGDASYQPRHKGKAMEDWVKKLKDVAHDADYVLEDINYEVLRRKVEIQNHMKKKVLNFFSLSNPILFRQKMAHKIKNINASLAALKSESPFVGLVAQPVDQTPPSMGIRETVSRFDPDEKTIGREKILSDIIATLTESKSQENKFSVQAIVGMGGLGKTTLARSIFNDGAIGKHFVEKMWVCVSNTFEVNSILSGMNGTGVKSREALLNDLDKRLTGKRYIMILDDVWNDKKSLWSDFTSCLSTLNSAPGSIVIVTTRLAEVALITETMPRCDLQSLSVENCWFIIKSKALPNDAPPLAPNYHYHTENYTQQPTGILMKQIHISKFGPDEPRTQYAVNLDKMIIYINNCLSTKKSIHRRSISSYSDLMLIILNNISSYNDLIILNTSRMLSFTMLNQHLKILEYIHNFSRNSNI